MNIRWHRHFEKRYARYPEMMQQKIQVAIARFIKNPRDPHLKNHALSGRLNRQRAFSVTGDIRIVFEEYENDSLVFFLDVGPNARIYSS